MAKKRSTSPVVEESTSQEAQAGIAPASAVTFSLAQVPSSVSESIVKPKLNMSNRFTQSLQFGDLDNDFISQTRANYKLNHRLMFNYNSSMLTHTMNRIPLIEGSIDSEIENNDSSSISYDFSSSTYIPSNGGKTDVIPSERSTYKNQDVIQYKNTSVSNGHLVSGDVANKNSLVNREIQANLGLQVSRSNMLHFKDLSSYNKMGDSNVSKSLFMRPDYSLKLNSDPSLGVKYSGYRRLSGDYNSSYMPMYFGMNDYSVDGRDEVNGFQHRTINYNVYTKYFTNRYYSSTDVDPVLHFSAGVGRETLTTPNSSSVVTEVKTKTGTEPSKKYHRHTSRVANIPKNNYESHTLLLADSNKFLEREFGNAGLVFSTSLSTESGKMVTMETGVSRRVLGNVNWTESARTFYGENANDLMITYRYGQFLPLEESRATSMTSRITANLMYNSKDWNKFRYLYSSDGYGYNTRGNKESPWVPYYENKNIEGIPSVHHTLYPSAQFVSDSTYGIHYSSTNNPDHIFLNHLTMDLGPSIDMRSYTLVRDSASVVSIQDITNVQSSRVRSVEYNKYYIDYMSHHGSINLLMFSHIQGDYGCLYLGHPEEGSFPARVMVDVNNEQNLSGMQSSEGMFYDGGSYTYDGSRNYSDYDFLKSGIIFLAKDGSGVVGRTNFFGGTGGSAIQCGNVNSTGRVEDLQYDLHFQRDQSGLYGTELYGGKDLTYGLLAMVTSRSSIYPFNSVICFNVNNYTTDQEKVFSFTGSLMNPTPLFNTPFNNGISYRLGFNPSHRAGQGLSLLCENQAAIIHHNGTGVNYLNTTTQEYAGFGNNAPYVTQKTNMKTTVALTTNASYCKYSLYKPLLKKIVERSTDARERIINASISDVTKKKTFFDPVDNQMYLSTTASKTDSHLPIDNLLVPSERFSNIYARFESTVGYIGTRDFSTADSKGDYYTYNALQKEVLGIKFEYMLDPNDNRYVDVHYETGIKVRTFPSGTSFSTTNPAVELRTKDQMLNELTTSNIVPIGEINSYGIKTDMVPDSTVKTKAMFNDPGIQLLLGEDRLMRDNSFFSLIRYDKLEGVAELNLDDNTGGYGRQYLYTMTVKNSSDSSGVVASRDFKDCYLYEIIEKPFRKNSKLKKTIKTIDFDKLYYFGKVTPDSIKVENSYSCSFYSGSNVSGPIGDGVDPIYVEFFLNDLDSPVDVTGLGLLADDKIRIKITPIGYYGLSSLDGKMSFTREGDLYIARPVSSGTTNITIRSPMTRPYTSGEFSVGVQPITVYRLGVDQGEVQYQYQTYFYKMDPSNVDYRFSTNLSNRSRKVRDGLYRHTLLSSGQLEEVISGEMVQSKDFNDRSITPGGETCTRSLFSIKPLNQYMVECGFENIEVSKFKCNLKSFYDLISSRLPPSSYNEIVWAMSWVRGYSDIKTNGSMSFQRANELVKSLGWYYGRWFDENGATVDVQFDTNGNNNHQLVKIGMYYSVMDGYYLKHEFQNGVIAYAKFSRSSRFANNNFIGMDSFYSSSADDNRISFDSLDVITLTYLDVNNEMKSISNLVCVNSRGSYDNNYDDSDLSSNLQEYVKITEDSDVEIYSLEMSNVYQNSIYNGKVTLSIGNVGWSNKNFRTIYSKDFFVEESHSFNSYGIVSTDSYDKNLGLSTSIYEDIDPRDVCFMVVNSFSNIKTQYGATYGDVYSGLSITIRKSSGRVVFPKVVKVEMEGSITYPSNRGNRTYAFSSSTTKYCNDSVVNIVDFTSSNRPIYRQDISLLSEKVFSSLYNPTSSSYSLSQCALSGLRANIEYINYKGEIKSIQVDFDISTNVGIQNESKVTYFANSSFPKLTSEK